MSKLYMKYFVLKPKGNNMYAEASRRALEAYARHILDDDPEFAKHLIKWIKEEEKSSEI